MDISKQSKKTVTEIIGNEYDDSLRDRLMFVLKGMGATVLEKSGKLYGGSQEIEVVDFQIGESFVRVEAETYIGLSISSEDAELVQKIRKQIRNK